MAITLADIPARDLPGASGIMAFARTISGAIGTSLITTFWERSATSMRSEVVGTMDHANAAITAAANAGLPTEQAKQGLSLLVDQQALMLATNQMFATLGPMLALTAFLIWFTKKPSADAMAAAQSAH
jgi:DHA2 family multidrug resistance protein